MSESVKCLEQNIKSINSIGSIEMYIGPMFAGKSTILVHTARKYLSIGMKILAINNQRDKRYGYGKITTHDKVSIPCIMVEDLNEVLSNENYFIQFKNSDIILIEELQFFDNIEFIVKAADKYNKKVLAFGLDGNYLRKPFQSVIDLIPYADKVVKLKGFCKLCSDGTPSIFSKRIIKSDYNILVGGSDLYVSVCRKHFLE